MWLHLCNLIGTRYTYFKDKEVRPFWPDLFSRVQKGGWARDYLNLYLDPVSVAC